MQAQQTEEIEVTTEQLDERKAQLDQEVEAARVRVSELREKLGGARAHVVLGVSAAGHQVAQFEAALDEAEKLLARQQAIRDALEPLHADAAAREAEARKAQAKAQAAAHERSRDEQLAVAARHLASAAEALQKAAAEDSAIQSLRREYGWQHYPWGVTRMGVLRELDRGSFILLRDIFENMMIGLFGYLKGERRD
ncbi:MAG TPA: hypothetical protein VJO34_14350 [Methylomirabilota bacterium]|nr:hypothetical protein [Methylomirabilota bacterium]